MLLQKSLTLFQYPIEYPQNLSQYFLPLEVSPELRLSVAYRTFGNSIFSVSLDTSFIIKILNHLSRFHKAVSPLAVFASIKRSSKVSMSKVHRTFFFMLIYF